MSASRLTQPSDPTLAPGEARCPGPSTREIIISDGDQAPRPLTAEETYSFLGQEDLPFERYTSRELFDLEMKKMWNRTWQWACREEHLSRVGDYYVYDIGNYSIVVLRSAPDKIQAFHNSCLHRGMQFFDAGTQGRGKQFLRCPFHGWSWNLDGSLKEVPCRWDFPHVSDEEFQLPEVKVETWGGFVFINLDPDAAPLAEQLEVLPEHFSQFAIPLEDRYVALHTEKVLPCNWKMGMEAFLEAYHVIATHPEGLRTAGDANAQYDIFGKYTTRFVHTIGSPSPHLRDRPSEEEILAVLSSRRKYDQPKLAEGETARTAWAKQMRETMGQDLDRDLSEVSVSQMMDSIEYWMFPNMMLFPGISIPLIYRFRPNGDDVDTCIHEVLFLRPKPANGETPPPAEKVRLEIEDSYTSIPNFPQGLDFVLDQDTDNLNRQRAGAKGAFKRGATLGNYQEARIRRFHATLDEFLKA